MIIFYQHPSYHFSFATRFATVNGGKSSFASTGNPANEGVAKLREIGILTTGNIAPSPKANGRTQGTDQKVSEGEKWEI